MPSTFEFVDNPNGDFPEQTYRQEIRVPFSYPVTFTRGLFEPGNPILAQVLRSGHEDSTPKLLAWIDDGVDAAHRGLGEKLNQYLAAHAGSGALLAPPEVVPGGERAKNGWKAVGDIMSKLGNHHLCRHSFVLAIGGGSVLDMVGFAASLVHRGVRLVRIPTTTLSQGDGGVGVKNGMDEHGQKNFVGTFSPPWAVLNDLDFLRTLDFNYWIGGVSEAFKVAIIKDAAFFARLEQLAEDLKRSDENAIAEVVRQMAFLHLEHIRTSGDPFEFGTARPLDFGHWAGHKLETLSGYGFGHGQAVAVGIALDSRYALRAGLITSDECTRIISAMNACGLPTSHRLLGHRQEDGSLSILQGLEEFREHLGGQLTITLPDGIGRRIEVHEINRDWMTEAIEESA